YSVPQLLQCPQSNLSLNHWLPSECVPRDPALWKSEAIRPNTKQIRDGRDESIMKQFTELKVKGRFQVYLLLPSNGMGKCIETSAAADLQVISSYSKVSGT
ncbi:hypothetical protein PANDA_016309, partial [Ailuropoda melanoleuca]